jgi:mannose-6-phosphate isomerase
MYIEKRPWGSFTVLEDFELYKIKRISVNPKQKLSYQSHSKRKECWTIVKGSAKVTLDGIEYFLTVGDSILIPVESKHRIENLSDEDMEFIEVQTGNYLGEDDIVRYSDDYGRV